MISFIARRMATMVFTMICLTLVVFYLVNLEPNLKKLALSQTNSRATQAEVDSWLVRNGYREPFLKQYAQWMGAWPKAPGKTRRASRSRASAIATSRWRPNSRGAARRFRLLDQVPHDGRRQAFPALGATGILMLCVLLVMVPVSLLIGILAGMREGSRTDRVLSVASIASTATPEYVSGVIFTVIFATWLGWLNGSAASATFDGITFYNFSLPVMTLAIYGIGYIARMTRASMVEVMTQQYIRTARLKGWASAASSSSTRCATR